MSINPVKNNGLANGGIPASAEPGKADVIEGAKAEKTARAAAAGGYARQAASPSIKDAANVQISAKAREMSLARKAIDEVPDVREDKIAQFKDLIAKGQYKPDAGKIADGIAAEAIKDELSRNPEIALS